MQRFTEIVNTNGISFATSHTITNVCGFKMEREWRRVRCTWRICEMRAELQREWVNGFAQYMYFCMNSTSSRRVNRLYFWCPCLIQQLMWVIKFIYHIADRRRVRTIKCNENKLFNDNLITIQTLKTFIAFKIRHLSVSLNAKTVCYCVHVCLCSHFPETVQNVSSKITIIAIIHSHWGATSSSCLWRHFWNAINKGSKSRYDRSICCQRFYDCW